MARVVPERCPFLSSRASGVCNLLHKRPTPEQVGCPDFYDAHTVTHRYCNHPNFLGEGYLRCAIFTKQHWVKQRRWNGVRRQKKDAS